MSRLSTCKVTAQRSAKDLNKVIITFKKPMSYRDYYEAKYMRDEVSRTGVSIIDTKNRILTLFFSKLRCKYENKSLNIIAQYRSDYNFSNVLCIGFKKRYNTIFDLVVLHDGSNMDLVLMNKICNKAVSNIETSEERPNIEAMLKSIVSYSSEMLKSIDTENGTTEEE